jgi:hypothetical protein
LSRGVFYISRPVNSNIHRRSHQVYGSREVKYGYKRDTSQEINANHQESATENIPIEVADQSQQVSSSFINQERKRKKGRGG